MCLGVEGGKERYVGSGEVWGGCGKVYGVSGEMCWRVGKECGKGNGEDVGKCVEVWGPNTPLIPHISLPLPFPTSPLTSPTPHHTFLHLLSYRKTSSLWPTFDVLLTVVLSNFAHSQ